MVRRILGVPLGLDHLRSPFDPHPDLVGQHYVFLYLTGRGEYSYGIVKLMENCSQTPSP
jgi:hypothetical protein